MQVKAKMYVIDQSMDKEIPKQELFCQVLHYHHGIQVKLLGTLTDNYINLYLDLAYLIILRNIQQHP